MIESDAVEEIRRVLTDGREVEEALHLAACVILSLSRSQSYGYLRTTRYVPGLPSGPAHDPLLGPGDSV